MTDTPRDRLRELLDAVLDERNHRLEDMASDAFVSPFHFSRVLVRNTGESPARMRRRVMLERAAWQIGQGSPVTEAAWMAGFESVEGFSRAFSRTFGHPPSAAPASYWLPAPNGIHFHPPTSLWVNSEERVMNPLTEQLVMHDLDDTKSLLQMAEALSEEELEAERMPGNVVLEWDGTESSIRSVLQNHVLSKEIWLASIEGRDAPGFEAEMTIARLSDLHAAMTPRWLGMIRDVDRRGAWNDRLIDALCDPPESFVMSSVIAHVLTYASHRRQLVRTMLRRAGKTVDQGDPIMWLRRINDLQEEQC
ncbi:MAG TPA: helix-turn-helix transcriptional regulator [Candidatus Agrococcus pullicola]|uniref:Helix-turn-helix transcriptional regulator n=1 Tax=Candidatus Agrococcus pullicola TaxID=2838429 RepID=A0A9D1YVH5_9MICO|nr:helix-turn-helix transcriptional regulator [Candidatus Agrococcus pullicola]